MKNWVNVKLISVVKLMRSGGTPKSDNADFYGGNIPFVSIEDMTASNKYLFTTIKTITEAGLQKSAAWLVPENTLMYSIYATLGVPVISKIRAATNQAILNIVVNPKKIDTEFLYYSLLSLKGQIHKYSSQTTQSNLNARIVKDFELYIPESLNEQIAIANILSKVDIAIEQTKSLIAKYQRIKTGLMQDLLTKGIDKRGNIRSKATHKFEVKNGIEVPEEWEVDQLGNVCSKIQDGTHFSPPLDENGEFKYITSKNIRFGRLDLSNIEYITASEHRKIYRRCDVRYGDVLLTKDGANTGNACINPLKEQFSLLSSVCILRGGDVLLNEYLLFWLLSANGQKMIKDSMSGLAITRITLNIINSFKIPLPSVEEQKKIVDGIQEIYLYENALSVELNKLKTLKIGLMQDLLSSSVRVKIKENQELVV